MKVAKTISQSSMTVNTFSKSETDLFLFMQSFVLLPLMAKYKQPKPRIMIFLLMDSLEWPVQFI